MIKLRLKKSSTARHSTAQLHTAQRGDEVVVSWFSVKEFHLVNKSLESESTLPSETLSSLLFSQRVHSVRSLSDSMWIWWREKFKGVLSLHTYSIDLIGYSCASCGWRGKAEVLCWSWGGTTHKQQNEQQTQDLRQRQLSNKQHGALTWRCVSP